MAKSSGGGSFGARRGGKIEAGMDLSKAKSLQKTGSSKPSLDSLKTSSKVTNKPNMSGKRMK
jgi:hypothetical protein